MCLLFLVFFFFNDTATTEIYTLSLHDALPISTAGMGGGVTGSGNRVIVADGQPGVSFIDVTTAATPRIVATQQVGGTAWDAKLARGNLYVANDSGIAMIAGVVAPPLVTTSRISIVRTATGATISGAPGAIADAAAPISLVVHDDTSNVAA